MKTACFLLVMIGLQVQGAAYVCTSNLTPLQDSSTSTDAGSDHPRNVGHTTTALAGDDKQQEVGKPPHQQANLHHVSGKNQWKSSAILVKATRPTPLRNSRQRSTTENVGKAKQRNLNTPNAGEPKIVNQRTLPVPLTGNVVLNGQQFKNSGNRGTNPAVVGGAASRAAINGTAISRKHAN
ncbi:MAG TPA: hypothetical protein VEI01_24530 [Terriglobales bacterium]|nr:hypothetical protein [Terriglobales bacterium]